MSTIQQLQSERRRSVRISPKGTIALFAGERVQHARIANISSGGLLAIGNDRFGEALLGAELELELRLDAASSEWLRLAGRVLRIDGRSLALAFETASQPFARLMEDSVVASCEDARVWTVVLVDASVERRGQIADAFRAVRCAVLEVSTPLEAIVRLGESRFEPDLIAIADSLPSSTSDELRRFAEREHPRSKLVIIGDDVLASSGDAHWLSSANLQGDLIARIRDLLGR